MASPRMVKKRVTFVHNQYNSPLGLYSTAEVADTLQRHTQLLTGNTRYVTSPAEKGLLCKIYVGNTRRRFTECYAIIRTINQDVSDL